MYQKRALVIDLRPFCDCLFLDYIASTSGCSSKSSITEPILILIFTMSSSMSILTRPLSRMMWSNSRPCRSESFTANAGDWSSG